MNDAHALAITIKEIVQTAFISFGIFLFVYIFLVQPHRVQGISMLPNFENGELLLTEKISYRFSNPKQGDVIVFEAPIGRKADFIKRVVALPGDTVKIENGNIMINGIVLDESYIMGQTEGSKELTLANGEYFVLGDNRSSSSDSRTFGPIKENSIRGKVWFVYWPLFSSGGYRGARLVLDVHNSVSNALYHF